MQAWHCIAIITISIILFIYGNFRSDIEDHIYEQELDKAVIEAKEVKVDSTVQKTNKSQVKVNDSIIDSPAWARYQTILRCERSEMAKLHAQALKGIPFLEFLNRQIQGSTTAKELIFSPFKSEFFAENDQGILRSLFTAHTTLADENLVEITCRGHSAKSAKLLAKLVLDTYEVALLQESIDAPLPGSLLKEINEINEMKQEIELLKEQLANENHMEKHLNVEAIALKSEIQMLDGEFQRFKRILLEVESYFKEGRSTMDYIQIEGFAKYGMLKEISETIGELNNMISSKSLDKAVTGEVQKNINRNYALLENEIAKAIEKLKEEISEGLERKKVLSNRLVDLHKTDAQNQIGNPKYRLLVQLEEKIERIIPIYQQAFKRWKSSAYTVVKSDLTK